MKLFPAWVKQVRDHLGEGPARMVEEWLLSHPNRERTVESVMLIINCALFEVLQGPGTVTVAAQLDPDAGTHLIHLSRWPSVNDSRIR